MLTKAVKYAVTKRCIHSAGIASCIDRPCWSILTSPTACIPTTAFFIASRNKWIENLGERDILPSGIDLYSAWTSLSRYDMFHGKLGGARGCGLHFQNNLALRDQQLWRENAGYCANVSGHNQPCPHPLIWRNHHYQTGEGGPQVHHGTAIISR